MCDMAGSEQLENIEFFKGKRVLVTGHTGFKGAWLSAVLNFMGADASGYALEAQPGCLYEKICGDELIHSVTGDLLDSRLLEQRERFSLRSLFTLQDLEASRTVLRIRCGHFRQI